ncbi:hypothetical protein [Dokdonia sp. LLG6352-1]|uniref:hypothetical protein n=1 Tax=Dokdonia sp. LLG6352-1 TaxID=3160831 RepID=UPI0038683ACA
MTKPTKFSDLFKDLVHLANKESETLTNNSDLKTNPYYVGFGKPNSDVLIVGQEKAIKSDNLMQIKAESLENPKHWNYLVENEIVDIDYKFYSDYYFKNPLHPYDGKPTKGNTWLQYQKLLNFIYPDFNSEKWNSFLLNSFITEINHQVSPRQLGNQKDEKRKSINNHDFYKSFNVTILAVGKYLKNNEIEDQFNVRFQKDYSEPRKRLLLFTNESENRIVLNIRQLSNDISTEYLKRIAEISKKYVWQQRV